jgi:hypothetical protein
VLTGRLQGVKPFTRLLLAGSAVGRHIAAKAEDIAIDDDVDIFREPFYQSPSF